MKARNIGWRLDLILASDVIAAHVVSCVVQREVGTSDHGPVIAEFNLGQGPRNLPDTPSEIDS